MLRDLQLDMMALITARDGVASALPEGGGLAAEVNSDARLDAVGRLQIYANMYGLRLRAALVSAFPVLEKVLGEERFTEMSAAYIEAHPSYHPSLRGLGSKLPGFLGGWQGELAALEWARHDVFDAADEPVLEMSAVAELGPERIGELPVRLIGAHRLVPVEHAIEALWRAAEAPEPPAEHEGVLLVWRDGVSVYHRRAGEGELEALVAAAEGLTFAALCERLAEGRSLDEAPRLAGALLGRWLSDKLLRA